MLAVRVTVETKAGFVHEIGQYEDMNEALRGFANVTEREPSISEPADDRLIKFTWVDPEIPY